MPRAPILTRYRVTVRAPQHGGGGDLPGLLDMLRYDGARVLAWEHASYEVAPGRFDIGPARYVITLESERFTPERWASFGIATEVIP